MNHDASEPADPFPRIADDGFVRMTLDAILTMRLEHLLSGVDRDDGEDRSKCGSLTAISGFSEWTSEASPYLSLGWDWRLSWEHGLIGLVRVGPPRSNIMLIDGHGIDYGWQRNFEVLGTVVDALPWRSDMDAALGRCTL